MSLLKIDLGAWFTDVFGRVPLYAISSLIALFSLEAAFFIDAIRDLYEVSRTLIGIS